MKPIDLIARTEQYRQEYTQALANSIKHYRHDKFEVGDKILFVGGLCNHLEFKSEILGFDENGGIYVLWECYWFPIYDEKVRNIRKLT